MVAFLIAKNAVGKDDLPFSAAILRVLSHEGLKRLAVPIKDAATDGVKPVLHEISEGFDEFFRTVHRVEEFLRCDFRYIQCDSHKEPSFFSQLGKNLLYKSI